MSNVVNFPTQKRQASAFMDVVDNAKTNMEQQILPELDKLKTDDDLVLNELTRLTQLFLKGVLYVSPIDLPIVSFHMVDNHADFHVAFDGEDRPFLQIQVIEKTAAMDVPEISWAVHPAACLDDLATEKHTYGYRFLAPLGYLMNKIEAEGGFHFITQEVDETHNLSQQTWMNEEIQVNLVILHDTLDAFDRYVEHHHATQPR